MKKLFCLLLAFSLVLSMAACQKKETTPSEKETPAKTTEDTPKKDEAAQSETKQVWTTGINPVQYEINWTVAGTTETYVRELTDPKYQGHVGGSEGNRAAANYIEEQFKRVGLQQLPTLGSWKQSYQTAVTSVLPGEAFLVAPDGT